MSTPIDNFTTAFQAEHPIHSRSASTLNKWNAAFLAHDTPVAMAAGQTVRVNLHVKNAGLAVWKRGGEHAVHIGYKWFNITGQQQRDVEDRRTALPADITPNQETSFSAILVAPRTPGTYSLRWDLIVEGITWFTEDGSPPFVLPVFVTIVPKDIGGWRVQSNLNPAEVAHTLNGDPRSFWDSSTLQAAGQWFRLNLSTPRMIDGIQFLSPGKGFPASYVLRVSAEGQTWNEVARAASDNAYDVMAIFAPQSIQYAQIDLLGESSSNWMISEILIHTAVAWTATASQNTDAARLAIDNNANTTWSSDVPQSEGMWFQIDLGHVETVSGIALTSPQDHHPAGFRIATWNAGANRWQVMYETANNAAPVDVTFAATRTQFINIQLVQPADKLWAIQHARVYREMDTWLGPRS